MNRGGRPTPALAQTTKERKPDSADIFFSQTNYGRILQPLREQYERKLNKPELPDDIDRRLQKTLSHYMTEVYRINSGQMPINSLNQESYRETTLNVDSWLAKQSSTTVQRSQPQQDNLFENVGSRFEREQQSRSVTQVPQSTPIDFSVRDDDEEAEDPIEKFERLRKLRESENRAASSTQQQKATAASSSSSSSNRNAIESNYSEPSAAPVTSSLPPVTQSQAPPPLLAPRPQEYIIKQEDVVKYKENELNLYINSGDRDWLANKNENRYNFTINFNTLNDNGNTFSPAIKERFRNITRMELVKTILSGESLEVTVLATAPMPVNDVVPTVLIVYDLPTTKEPAVTL
jgi:hypothetical protein